MHTGWSSHKTDFQSIGGFVVIWQYFYSKFDKRVTEPTAHLQTSCKFWNPSRNRREEPYRINPRHTRSYFRIKSYTKPRKICTVDDADSRCEHPLRHGEMINILTIA